MAEKLAFTHLRLPGTLNPKVLSEKRARELVEPVQEILSPFVESKSLDRVFVFVSEGYEALLGTESPVTGYYAELLIRRAIRIVKREYGAQGLKIESVGMPELAPTLVFLKTQSGKSGEGVLAQLLLGSGGQLKYDSPKFVEAIIRLARSDDAIFRFDADVRPQEASVESLIATQKQEEKAGKKYYLFSGDYTCEDPDDPDDRWMNCYPVRLNCFVDREGHIDEAQAEAFLNDLAGLGVDPRAQVISGAGLCMSHAAIRALPPFCNTSDFVVWIDDQLKRLLHEQMGHLAARDVGRVEGASFAQSRGKVWRPPDEMCFDYFARLVRGCLFSEAIRHPEGDSWLAGRIRDARYPGLYETVNGELSEPLDDHYQQITERWSANVYVDSPLRTFATERLEELRDALVKDVLESVFSYFDLLRSWHLLSERCGRLREEQENRWIFEPSVLPPEPSN